MAESQVTNKQYESALSEYEAAQSEIAELDALLSRSVYDRGAKFVYKGKSYSREQIQSFATAAQKKSNEAKKIVDKAESFINSTQSEINRIDATLKQAGGEGFAGQTQRQVSTEQRGALLKKKSDLQKRLANFRQGVVAEEEAAPAEPATMAAAPAKTTATTTTTTQPKTTDATGRFRQFEQANLAAPASTGGGAGTAPKPKAGKADKKNKKPKPAAGTVVDGVYITNTGKRVNIDTLRQQYPTYAWVFDVDERFNDTRDLTIQFLAGDITEERYAALLPQSSWYRDRDNVLTTQRIKNRYGDIGLPPTALSTLVSQTISFNYDDAQLDQAFYGEVFKRDPITGAYINEAARNTVLKGQSAAEIRNNARAMFTTASDDDIENILSGKTTYEDFDRSIRNTAKAVYGNWASMLDDPAMTMEKIVRPWQEMAGSVLEMDPSQIDMTRPEFQAAYNTTDATGNPKALSLGEWYVKLRSDPTYKWEKTTQAKSEARDLAFNLAKVFGKIV